MVVDGARGVALHEAPVVDDRDAVRHGQRLALVVGDVDRGHAELLVQVPQLDLHVVAQLLVERRQRLVHQQDPRLEDDGPGERHPLLLAAGELVDAPLGEPVELHGRERALDPLAHVALRHTPHPQGEGDVPGHRHVREQRVVLEHHPHVPPVRRHPDDLPVTEADAAVVGAGETRQHHQQGGLAGTGRSEQGDEFPAPDFEIDMVERVNVAVGLGDLADVNGQRPARPGLTGHWLSVAALRARSRSPMCRNARAGDHGTRMDGRSSPDRQGRPGCSGRRAPTPSSCRRTSRTPASPTWRTTPG